jgi:hypothetical protein
MFSVEALLVFFVLFAVIVCVIASVRILRNTSAPSFSP